MQSDKWLLFSPFLIVIMGITILYGLIRLNKRIKDWKIISLSLIPSSFIILYGWVLLFSPPIETVRLATRFALVSDMAIAIHVITGYIKDYNEGGK